MGGVDTCPAPAQLSCQLGLLYACDLLVTLLHRTGSGSGRHSCSGTGLESGVEIGIEFDIEFGIELNYFWIS